MTISAHVENFLKYLEFERNTSQLTIKNYDHYLKRFLDFLKDELNLTDLTPSQIDLPLITKYNQYLVHFVDPKTKKPLKKITQNYFMIAIRAFLRYLKTINVSSLSADQVKLAETEQRALKTLDDSHIRQLLEAPDITKKDGIRDRAILETLFSTGLRVSELTSLNRATIDLVSHEFTILGKGGRERVVFISESAAVWLDNYFKIRTDTFKPLFIRFQGKVELNEDGEKMRLTPRSIERIVEKYAKSQGLPIKVTPQILRHSFATDLLTGGADIKSVQEKLGHNNLSTTQIYSHVGDIQNENIERPFHPGN